VYPCICVFRFFLRYCYDSSLLPFPTRRSSDLLGGRLSADGECLPGTGAADLAGVRLGAGRSFTASSVLEVLRARWERRAQTGERSEEHTSELQSRENLVCRLLLEKTKLLSSLV